MKKTNKKIKQLLEYETERELFKNVRIETRVRFQVENICRQILKNYPKLQSIMVDLDFGHLNKENVFVMRSDIDE